MTTPIDAIDYPKLDPGLFVCSSGSAEVWPSAHRQTFYLSKTKTHTMNGSALYTSDWQDAKTFKTASAAGQWMLENRRKRGQAYDGTAVISIADLIATRFAGVAEPALKAKKAKAS